MGKDPTQNGRFNYNDAEPGTWPEWLDRADLLLAEPDPGPLPWLIRDVMVDKALIATVGRWKTTKTYWNLDVAISVATGLPFLGRLQVENPGPVIVVLEESGRSALWRRLDSLCRGRAIDRELLRDLYCATNQRVRLDNPAWQNELADLGRLLKPSLYLFDPLARLKSAGTDENAQKEYATVIEFLRDLRDETGAAVNWTHHTGHQGDQMRGTSDLESVWETRQGFKRDGQTVTVTLEHREADSGLEINYRLDWDETTRSIRLEEIDPPDEERRQSVTDLVLHYVAEHGGASGKDIEEAVGHNATFVRKVIEQLHVSSALVRGPRRVTRSDGRPFTRQGWFLASEATIQAETVSRPPSGTRQDETDETRFETRGYDNDIPF